jgi:hypothetical protein
MILVFRFHVFHRLTALMLLMMLSPLTYAGAACAGWSGAPGDRMACCQRAAGCASVSADDCCAEGEQRQNLEQVAAALITSGATVSQRLHAAAPRPQCFVPDPLSLTGRPATYLLDSVFLI